jgi:hypothetical protein
MSWLTRFLISNWSLALVPIVLLCVWLSGVWVGEGRTQRAWDAERHQAELAQARAEQKSSDIKRSQEQINHEISNEFNQRSAQLAADLQSGGFVRMRSSPADFVGCVSAVPATSGAVAPAPPDLVSVAPRDESAVSCAQLAMDAAKTTLMLVEIQKWYERQAEIQSNLDQ